MKDGICVLFYPYDGEQAFTGFYSLSKLRAGNQHEQNVAYAIDLAMKDQHKIAEVDFEDVENITSQSELSFPCLIDIAVTLYIPT